jgi:hypothetical protein
MDFSALRTQVIELLQREGRVAYRALKLQFQLDDDHLEALKDELIFAKKLAMDEDSRVLVWAGEHASASSSISETPALTAAPPSRAPLAYTPQHLAEKILTSRSALEGERKQVTVLFADVAGWKRNKKVAVHPCPEHLCVQDTRRGDIVGHAWPSRGARSARRGTR